MNNFGFIKVAAAIPSVRVADCGYNSEQIIGLMARAAEQGVRVVVFPELSITSCTCGDLITQPLLLNEARKALKRIVEASHDHNLVSIVGLPVAVGEKIYNCAAVVAQGEIKGFIPKQCLSAMEQRWFSSGAGLEEIPLDDYALDGQQVWIGCNQLFEVDGVGFGIEIGDDMHSSISPSTFQAKQGAKIIFNPSAQVELSGIRRRLEEAVLSLSVRLNSAYVVASSGFGESTTDVVYAGNALIAECGEMLAESERFSIHEQLIVADVDSELILNARRTQSDFAIYDEPMIVNRIYLDEQPTTKHLCRKIEPLPFLNQGLDKDAYCEEIFSIQVLGLMKRLQHTSCRSAVIGISGGLDSTLALLVAVKAFDRLGLDRKGIVGVTMPGFGTTDRTYNNAVTLIKELGITFREISIAAACRQHFADIGLQSEDRSVAFENAQARERTQILMDVANMTSGMVIGTGDLSELALGWATYNGDQMSMYGVNCNIAKTLVRHLVMWVADNEPNKLVSEALKDVVATPVSPELLPAEESGEIAQKTEDLVGPYELHDFFLYNFLKNRFSPSKILFLAERAFEGKYDRVVILKWLKTFFRRFFTQQFKRSASPDGVKVCEVGLSPRGDWNMPSDASANAWLAACEKLN